MGIPRPTDGEVEDGGRGGVPSLGMLVLDGRGGAELDGGSPPMALTLRLGPFGGGGVARADTLAEFGSFLLTHFLRSGS